MILIPQRLFESPEVHTILRDGNTCILHKELTSPVLDREGYISNHVVSVVLEGEQQIRTYEDEIIQVKAGELLFIPRGMYYVTDLLPQNGNFRSLLFYFDDSIIQEFLSTSKVTTVSREEVPDHLKFGAVPTLQLFADSLIGFYQQQKIKDKNLLKLKILELLYLLNGQAAEQQFANFLFRLTLPKKRNIKVFMEHNFTKPLKIEDYAYLTGRSLSSFRRDFKAFYDVTPQRWLKEKRLEKAANLLDKQGLHVSDVAFEVGYENVSYFIQAFKSQYGKSPKQYMLAHRRNELRP